MKIFVTGGAGFIGSTIVDKLLSDDSNSVTVIDNFVSGQDAFIEHHFKDKRFKLIKGDLLDLDLLKKSVKGYDIVYHFAANPDIARAMHETDLDLRLGVIATYNLLEAMRLNSVNKIVYTSGSGVYGDVGYVETPEDFGPLLPTSMYGASKLGAEGIISAFCYMFNMKSWIFRFANVVGKRQTHGVAFDFIKKLKEDPKQLLILGDGNQSKSYIHVFDVLDAISLVVENANATVNVYNVATGDYITVNEIADIVIKEMGLENVRYEYTGGSKGWKGDVPVVRFNLDKIYKLGWKAKYSSKEAVIKSVKEMLEKENSIHA